MPKSRREYAREIFQSARDNVGRFWERVSELASSFDRQVIIYGHTLSQIINYGKNHHPPVRNNTDYNPLVLKQKTASLLSKGPYALLANSVYYHGVRICDIDFKMNTVTSIDPKHSDLASKLAGVGIKPKAIS